MPLLGYILLFVLVSVVIVVVVVVVVFAYTSVGLYSVVCLG